MLMAFLLMEIWELSSPFSSWPPLSQHGGGACWQTPSCIPRYAIQLSWVTSPVESGPEQSPNALLPLHRADKKVTTPLEWEGLGWIQSLHERTPELGHTLQSLTRICLNMLFMQSYWLAPTDPIWSHRNAMWGQTGSSMRICRVGFSWSEGCFWDSLCSSSWVSVKWVHTPCVQFFQLQQLQQGDTLCFKQAAAQVALLRANESNASCLTDQPACLSPPPTLQGKANFLMYTVFSWLGVFV